jgi:hypothetical protein
VSTPLRRECRRRSSNEWDTAVECEVQGEDAGGGAFSEQNIATQRLTSSDAAITIRPADPTAVPVEKETWYFVSPPSWSRDISQAYDGFLLVRIVHRVIPARARVPGHDVLLTARCGHYLSQRLPIDEGLAGRTHKLQLNVESGWIDSRTGRVPTRQSFLGVLAHLRDVKIRGGYYYGYEVTSLVTAEVLKGEDAPFACCSSRGQVTSCHHPPSDVLTESGTRFPCEGEEHEVVRVHRVEPRFSRRTGGDKITVTGENFGLLGTQPIVRIGGRPCKRTAFWEPPQHCTNNRTDANLGETGVDRGGYCFAHECFNGLQDGLELQVDCAGRCLPCKRRAGKTAGHPPQKSVLVCETPAFGAADLPAVEFHMDGAGEGMDLSVSVEAAGAWMPLDAQHRADPSTQISCISPEARGFQVGGLGAAWGARVLGNGSQAEVVDVSFALPTAAGGLGQQGQVGGGGASYAVGSVRGRMQLASSMAPNSSFWSGGLAGAHDVTRGFVLKRDGAGRVLWVCELGGGGRAPNVTLHSVAPALPLPGLEAPATTTPPPGTCIGTACPHLHHLSRALAPDGSLGIRCALVPWEGISSSPQTACGPVVYSLSARACVRGCACAFQPPVPRRHTTRLACRGVEV